ncbi:hypothetical protein B0H19DRAFT_1264730 [Mycena capillaripes]|nr:hypothetical protein B0H19DRAFT_1264730 [Mycena capillaripes]
MSLTTIAPPTPQPLQLGLLHTASTNAARRTLEELLHKDYVSHHCFFNDLGYHNHLPHHLVAVYDMGAPPALLTQIYKELAPTLRPIERQGEDITETNWTTRLGERKAYGSYLLFFAERIAKSGVPDTMRKYIMAPEANANEALMLARFSATGSTRFFKWGLESNSARTYMVAQGLAETAVTESDIASIALDMPSGIPEIAKSSEGGTLLGLLREVYDSPILKPLPYDPDATYSTRLERLGENPDRGTELKRIYAKWSIDTTLTSAAADQELANKAEECLWQATLLLAATSKPNRAPRFDFWVMHILAAALCIPRLLLVFTDPLHKAQLLQAYARASAVIVLMDGRPHIDIPLLMSYPEFPRPPAHLPPGGPDAVGDPSSGDGTNPWLAIVQNALHHKDAHFPKAVRTLYYAAMYYGGKGSGGAIGARDEKGQETHIGAGALDGTVFVRAAGVMSDSLGWIAYGAKQGDWGSEWAWVGRSVGGGEPVDYIYRRSQKF